MGNIEDKNCLQNQSANNDSKNISYQSPAEQGAKAGYMAAQLYKKDYRAFAQTKIQYIFFDNKTEKFSLDSGLAFARMFLWHAFDKDNDRIVKMEDLGPIGLFIDLDDDGMISPAEYLSFLMLQDNIDPSGFDAHITSFDMNFLMTLMLDKPKYIREKLKDIYNTLELDKKQDQLEMPRLDKNLSPFQSNPLD